MYIFAIAAAPNGMLYVFETHPITEEIGGNRNGLIVKSDSCSKLIEWLILRLVKSGVDSSTTPFLILVNEKNAQECTVWQLLKVMLIHKIKLAMII